MMEKGFQVRTRRWITVGWSSLFLGWLAYFALMAFSQRSPSMHSNSGLIAIATALAVTVFAVLGMRNREGGHVILLTTLLATPVIWYFASVVAMTIIANF
jgi:hypothetical protein